MGLSCKKTREDHTMSTEEINGPISELLYLLGGNMGPLTRIPILGIPFIFIVYVIQFMAAFLHGLTGLK